MLDRKEKRSKVCGTRFIQERLRTGRVGTVPGIT